MFSISLEKPGIPLRSDTELTHRGVSVHKSIGVGDWQQEKVHLVQQGGDGSICSIVRGNLGRDRQHTLLSRVFPSQMFIPSSLGTEERLDFGAGK